MSEAEFLKRLKKINSVNGLKEFKLDLVVIRNGYKFECTKEKISKQIEALDKRINYIRTNKLNMTFGSANVSKYVKN